MSERSELLAQRVRSVNGEGGSGPTIELVTEKDLRSQLQPCYPTCPPPCQPVICPVFCPPGR